MKVGFEIVLNENHTSDSDSKLEQGGALESITSTANRTSCIVQVTSNGTSGHVPGTSNENSGIVPSTSYGSSGFIPVTSTGTSDIDPHTSYGNSDIVPHSVADDPGISSIYANTVQQEEEQKIESPHEFFCRVVNEFPPDIMEPTEMLRYLQKKIISGRPLEVSNSSQVLEGETNFITVDRHNIL